MLLCCWTLPRCCYACAIDATILLVIYELLWSFTCAAKKLERTPLELAHTPITCDGVSVCLLHSNATPAVYSTPNPAYILISVLGAQLSPDLMMFSLQISCQAPRSRPLDLPLKNQQVWILPCRLHRKWPISRSCTCTDVSWLSTCLEEKKMPAESTLSSTLIHGSVVDGCKASLVSSWRRWNNDFQGM